MSQAPAGSGDLDELVEVLEAERERLERLVPLLEEEHAAARRGDARAVGDVTARKEALAAEIRGLEGRRRRVMERLAASLGIPAQSLTLSALAARASAPRRLAALREDLQRELRRVAALSHRNRLLLEESVRCLGGLLDAVRSALSQAPTYGAGGRGVPAAAAHVVDRTA